MIASVGRHPHAKPTPVHTHLLLLRGRIVEAEKSAADIHTPPSCAAMINQACEV